MQKHPPQPHRRMIIHSRKCLMMLVRGKGNCKKNYKNNRNGYVVPILHKFVYYVYIIVYYNVPLTRT